MARIAKNDNLFHCVLAEVLWIRYVVFTFYGIAQLFPVPAHQSKIKLEKVYNSFKQFYPMIPNV